MPDEPREVKPFQMFDKGKKSEIDFRPMENFPEEVDEVTDPKDSSAPEPVISSTSALTIEPKKALTASAGKGSTKLKAVDNGRLTSSEVI